ncbi:hypothetical protein CONCODRAFT_12872 [Conidiobolus coronatus NRRL 28638]|uniref:Uncharacterized protein n=1 Tax=Conidiobolus coronatus (strain ATCC 28846 / CBS 209.66 / NRRL 28638) TaxID=796925 RepID=A0A137NS46_CONC2|nr:hypothetical protein CONCODRAFT_12872 [Conidiobolus coronatus NRRL 28638]|eukprot:KXN65512.1 hypothetical protein CONCODRAFT_12872 [Conidiobolus coronatus NRRL 28638]
MTTETEAYPVKATTISIPNGEYSVKPTATEAYPVKTTTEAYPVKATTTEVYPVKVTTSGPYGYPVATTIVGKIEQPNVVVEPTYVTKPTSQVKKCKSKQH